MSRDRIWGGERFVLYLPAAANTLAAIDGSRESNIRSATEKFLESPRAAWDKNPEDFVWQVRGLNTNTRAFATWCQNTNIECEVFIVQDIYKKSNEAEYWNDIGEYNDAGREYDKMFQNLSKDEYEEWLSSLSDRTDLLVVLDE